MLETRAGKAASMFVFLSFSFSRSHFIFFFCPERSLFVGLYDHRWAFFASLEVVLQRTVLPADPVRPARTHWDEGNALPLACNANDGHGRHGLLEDSEVALRCQKRERAAGRRRR